MALQKIQKIPKVDLPAELDLPAVIHSPLDMFGTLTEDGWTPHASATPRDRMEAAAYAWERKDGAQFVFADTLIALEAGLEGVEAVDWLTGNAIAPPGDEVPWLPVERTGELDAPVEVPPDAPKGALLVRPVDASQMLSLSDYDAAYQTEMLRVARKFPPDRRKAYWAQYGKWPVRFTHLRVLSAADLPQKFVDRWLQKRAAEGVTVSDLQKAVRDWRTANGKPAPSGAARFELTREDALSEQSPLVASALGIGEDSARSLLAWVWDEAPLDVLQAAVRARRT